MSTSHQPSRKGKKAWRKNVDISDVQSGLEQLREEITQGGVIKEKSNDLLFSMDLGGDLATDRRLLKSTKLLRSDQILAERSAIPAVDTRKRVGEVCDGVVEKKKKRKDGVSYSQLQRLRAIAYGGAKAAPSGVLSSSKKALPDYDPWGDEAVDKFKNKADLEIEALDFVEDRKKVKAPVTLKRKPTALAAIGTMPAVRLPGAGISYNPDFDKWDELLRAEGEKEVELEKKRLAVEAEDERIQALVDDSEQEFLSDDDDAEVVDSDSSSDESGNEDDKAKREAKRKTQAQKNKALRLKERERKLDEAKKAKKQERELMLVKKYNREIKVEERLRMARQIAKMTAPDDDEKNPQIMRKKRFGKIHLPRAPLEVQLPDELADSLRLLKPEGNLLSDRFRSLRERGIVEARTPVVYAKKAKKSMTEKWSYKDFK